MLILQIAILLLLILLNALFAMAEMALVSARKTRLQNAAERGQEGARTAVVAPPVTLMAGLPSGRPR